MKGQYTNDEIMDKVVRSENHLFKSPYQVHILFGKTWNVYVRHDDYSWTNVDCHTI